MPSFTGTAVADLARIYLNNISGTVYNNSVMLPIINDVLDNLLIELLQIDAPVTTEVTSAYSVVALTTSINPTLIHARFVAPIYIKERAPGSPNYSPMFEKRWLPDTTQTSQLIYWQWIGDLIKLIGATSIVEIQVRHTILLPSLAAIGDSINITGAKTFMAAETAAIAAFALGQNPTMAKTLHDKAETAKTKFFGNITKKNQTLGFTRPGYNRPRRQVC